MVDNLQVAFLELCAQMEGSSEEESPLSRKYLTCGSDFVTLSFLSLLNLVKELGRRTRVSLQ